MMSLCSSPRRIFRAFVVVAERRVSGVARPPRENPRFFVDAYVAPLPAAA
jgi:hypothetical protein